MAYRKKTGGRLPQDEATKKLNRQKTLAKRYEDNVRVSFEIPKELAEWFLAYTKGLNLNRTQGMIKILTDGKNSPK